MRVRARCASCTASETSCCWSPPTASRPSSAADADPRQGPRADQPSLFWFDRQDGAQSPTDRGATGLPRPPARAGLEGRACSSADADGADRVRRPRLPGRLGWKEYQATAPSAARTARRAARDGPAARADLHAGHQGRDRTRMNITFEPPASHGHDRAPSCEQPAIGVYQRRPTTPAERGIIIADTKFEFGLDASGQLILIDEVLTPDSSRSGRPTPTQPGRPQPSFDKQYVRDWLETPAGTRRRPGRSCPTSRRRTRSRYVEAYERLTGELRRLPATDGSVGMRGDGAGATPGWHPRSAGGGHPPLAGRARPPDQRGARGQGVRSRGSTHPAPRRRRRLATEVAETVLSNPLIESVRGRGRGRCDRVTRVGVVTFPGACDDRDAAYALPLCSVPSRWSLWHE